MTWWAWLIVGAVLLSAELFAVDAQFYLVFLGVSAIIVGLGTLFGIVLPEWAQWLVFAILSLFFFFTFRQTLYRKLRATGENYPESISGESIRVEEGLAPGAETRTEYRGTKWTVRNVGAEAIAEGARARVTRVQGLTLHVVAE